MIAALARRAGNRAAAAALAVTLGVAYMMLGAGTASAAPLPVTCTIGALPEPVTVSEGSQVQLVLVVPLLGTRVNVGPAQTAATPGEQVLSATISGVIGIVNGTLCRAVVQVIANATSVAPLPPLPSLPTLPSLLPSTAVQVPVPGADVSVQTGGTSSSPGDSPGSNNPPASPPGTQPPSAPGSPTAPSGTAPNYRFDLGRLPYYDFSSVPYGVSSRFGAAAAPAFRFGQQVPGYAPQFGILGDAQNVAAAGKVEALPVRGAAPVGLPVLLAVLMLSTVSGALVRTWALRRPT